MMPTPAALHESRTARPSSRRSRPEVSCRPIVDRDAWNEALLRLPANHVLQSWDWGAVKARHGWTPVRLLWERGDCPLAAAQVLRRSFPHTPWGVVYVPKGPALDYEDTDLVERVLSDLEAHSRRQRAIFGKLDPDVHLNSIVDVLVARGWRYSDEQIQFRNTALLDLRPPEADLLAQMKSKTRYNVRLARRRGVAIRAGTEQDLPGFYRMYAETGQRDDLRSARTSTTMTRGGRFCGPGWRICFWQR